LIRFVAPLAAKLAGYAGRYVGVTNADSTTLDVTVAEDGKTLSVYNRGARRSLPLVPVGGNLFVGLELGGEWPFERSEGANTPVQSLALGVGPNRGVLIRQR
jgi:hypothetical protein